MKALYFSKLVCHRIAAGAILLFFAGMLRCCLWAEQTATNSFVSQPLSLEDAINLALHQSPDILRAQQTLRAEQGVEIQTRAVALPHLGVTGNYTAVEPSDVDQPPMVIPGFTFGTDQSWRAQIRLVQSIYQGGRILSSLRAARLVRERALLNYQVAVADLVLRVQTAYYAVLLAQQQIVVQEASVELLTRELTDTQRRYQAGTVPRFNVLRAEVELANARPQLISARNRLRITRNLLANVLALQTGTAEELPLNLSGTLESQPWSIDFSKALVTALQRRSELDVLRKSRALRREDVVSARAGYKPGLSAFAGYEGHSSIFSSDLTQELHGWLAGVELQWSIFDGGLTRGKVKQAQALYDLAGVELDDTSRRIELDVRTAHSTFVEATELLESQRKVQESAEEALRLARARSEAGTGTQLDVLSAQTALTQARTTQVQALHDYMVARARLERAMGVNTPEPAGKFDPVPPQ